MRVENDKTTDTGGEVLSSTQQKGRGRATAGENSSKQIGAGFRVGFSPYHNVKTTLEPLAQGHHTQRKAFVQSNNSSGTDKLATSRKSHRECIPHDTAGYNSPQDNRVTTSDIKTNTE